MADDPRVVLERLVRERGEDYAGLSRLLGRNPAYVQQYIKRGTPRALAEEDRRRLAEYFGIDEERLGGQPARQAAADPLRVPRLDLGASAGPGAAVEREAAVAAIAFDRKWLRRIGIGDAGRLSCIEVRGDSMIPALSDGDEILVDGGDAGDRLRDGIYVVRVNDALMVKRVAVNPAGRRLTISSDNPAYRSFECDAAEVAIVGRVVWVGRRLA